MSKFTTFRQEHNWVLPLMILFAVALIIALLVATKPTPPKVESVEKEWLVSTKAVEITSASPELTLLGRVESPFDSLLSAAISAEVIDLKAREGQHVKKGEVLIELDKREIKLQVIQAQADVNELEALIISENNRFKSDQASLTEEQRLLEIAQQGVKRQAKLKASKLVAQERIDNAESQRAQQALSLNARKLNIADHPSRLNQLKARIARAKTSLSDALIDAERAEIKAPFDGIITDISVAPGERVQVGQALISLYDRSNMEVRAQLPNRHVSLIKKALDINTRIHAQTESYGQKSSLLLRRLSGKANSNTGGIDALFTPPEDQDTSEHTLVLNNSLEIKVTLPPIDDVITLPLSAIYGSNRVYRIEDGRLQSIDITILGKQLSNETEQGQVIIKSKTLNKGDIVVITQLPNAISGLKVKARDKL